MPRAEGVGRGVGLLLRFARAAAALIVAPPVGQELDFGGGDIVIVEDPAQLAVSCAAILHRDVILDRDADSRKARLGGHGDPLPESEAWRLEDTRAGKRVGTRDQIVAAKLPFCLCHRESSPLLIRPRI